MAIISKVGRNTLKTRMLIFSIYAALTIGAVTMVYPFLLMMAGSTKTSVDTPEAKIIPPYLVDDNALYRKHAEGLFNESIVMGKICLDVDVPSFRELYPPVAVRAKLVSEWMEFIERENLPDYFYGCSYVSTPMSAKSLPVNMRAFKNLLVERFDGDIDRMNTELGSEYENWAAFYLVPEDYLQRRNQPQYDRFSEMFREFKKGLGEETRYYFSPEGFYKHSYLKSQYTKEIEAYNGEHGTSFASWDKVHLDRRVPSGKGRTGKEREDWTTFVRSILNLFWIRADNDAAPEYRNFLRAKYQTVEVLNRNYGTSYESFRDVPIVKEPPSEGLVLSDWDIFLQGWKDPDTGKMHILPAEKIYIHSIDFMFRDYLLEKYGSLKALNAALETSFADELEIIPPQEDFHYIEFRKMTASLRKEFTLRNYISVLDYMVLRGRGVFNTAVYCFLLILCVLTVNPLAAYALSRYKPPSAYKFLLFLMLTMAFPPIVTQIPNFLMLRKLNLLNTFRALILPGMASGYSIFLLKGFFDSQPKELYESAEIDGAGEFRIFWQITMSLSTPILAVTALQAFTLAYSNFMMALLICQDQKMWTIMPWLYQLQQQSGQGVVYASLIIAAIPIFVVFVLCQKVIMRGIVVPVEK